MKTKNYLIKSWLLMMLMLIGAGGNLWAADETIVFSELSLENATQYASFDGSSYGLNFSLAFGNGGNDGKYYTTGSAIRVYGGGHMIVTSSKTIAKIELTFGSGDGSNTITTDVGSFSNGTWTGSATSVTFTVGGSNGNRRIASVAVTYESGSSGGEEPTIVTDYSIDFENELDAYTAWSFSKIGRRNSDNSLSAHGGTYYATNSTSSTSTSGNDKAYIQTKQKVANPEKFVCHITRATTNSNSSKWYIQVSTDGSTWTNVKEQSATSMAKGTWVEFSDDLTPYSDVYVRLYYEGSTAIRCVDDITLTLRDESKQDVTLSFPQTTYEATMGAEFNAPTASAEPTVTGIEYSSSNTSVATVDANTGAVTLVAAGSTTITATFAGDEEYNGASASYTLNVARDPNANDGSAEKPYTVAEARAVIDAGTGLTGVYVKGIVSGIVTVYNSEYGNISYNISEDGSTEAVQLQAYRGKSYNGDKFTSENNIEVGDQVVIYGDLKKYNSTYELDANNKLISNDHKDVTFSFGDETEFEVALNKGFTAPDLIKGEYNGTVTYASSNTNVAAVATDGTVTLVGLGEATITASGARTSAYHTPTPASYTLTVVDAVWTVEAQASEGGTVSLDGKVITATPAEGYRFANPAYTVSSGEATVSQEGNIFTVTPASDCTVTINFEAIPTHKVTWSINGETSEETFAEGAALTHETPADIEGKTFVGWVIAPIEGELENAPTSLITNPVMGTDDVTYYAVYANVEGEEYTATLTDSEIIANFTNDKMAYGTAETFVDGNVTWTANAYADQNNRPWFQIKKSADAYFKISSESNISNVKLTLTAAKNSSGGILDITKHDPFTGTVYLESEASASPVGALGSSDAVTDNVVILTPSSPVNELYIQTSAAARIWGAEVTYGSANVSGYCTTVIKPVAKIGNKGFETLQAAVDAAEAGETIDIVDDFTLTTVTTSPSDKYNVNVNKSVTINGNNHVITSAEGKRAIVLEGEGLDVTIKDLTIKNNKAEACLWIASNLTCTLDNTVLDGTNGKTYNQPLTIGSVSNEGRVTLNVTNGSVIKTNDAGTAHYAIIAWHPADITVTDSKLIGWANVYLKPDAAGSTVKIEGSEMKSQGLSGNSNNFSILVTEGGNNTIEVKDTKITSSAVEGTYESLITLGGEGNVVKLLGETTYETNDKTWGAITYNWGSLMNNKLYLDDTTKAAFAEYLDGSHQETIDPADETGLYPVSFEPEVLYYWAVGDSYQGGYYSFADPFKNGWLADGEFIALQKDITLTEDITCQLASGTSFNFLLGDFTADKNGHSVSLADGVKVITDKQTDIFSAATEGSSVYEEKTETGYIYTVGNYVARCNGVYFATLQAAVDAAEAGQTIDIVDDFTLTTVATSPSDKYNVNVNKSVTINGNNHVITSAEGKRAIVLEGEGLDVTIKDLTIKNNKAEACLWIASNLTCTLDNAVLDGTNGKSYNQPLTIGSISNEGRVTLNVTNGSVIKTNDAGTAHYAIIAWHPADITVTDSKLIGWANVYLKPDAAGSTVKIEGSEMKSQGLSGNSNNFSILVTEGGNNTIEVKDTKITSSAVEGTYQSLITLGGEGNVVKLLGETTYETNDKTWGAITYNWGSLMNNKLYLDDTTKAAFAEYLDGSHQETIDPADETGLYPVNYVSEIHYYWAVEGGYDGGYYSFADPFKNGWLADGEFIALQKDITLTEDIACKLASGTSFNFLLGDFTADKNGHSVALNTGVTVLTDKQTDIFKAAEAGYMIEEAEVEGGFTYTAVKVEVAAPIVFHDGGTYEEALTVPMIAQAGAEIYYSTDGESFTKYTQPLEISATTTVTAYAMLLGAKSSEVTKTFTIEKKTYDGETFDGYYTIQNNGNGKFVNVAGRKTVTFVDEDATATAPGTVIRVKTNENGQVEVLRSQGVDLPRYAEKAMNYVPELAKALVERLGENDVIGEDGVNLIANEFKAKFDYHLYLEKADGGYRIYGKTPSMKHVVDFYANNKEIIDSRLPKLEGFVEDILEKVAERLNHAGSAWASKFKIHDIWTSMGGAEAGLTEPVEGNEAAISKFYTEVLSSEKNVWDFAYQTAMIYWTKVEDLVKEHAEQLGDYSKYLTRVKNIKPDFKYYIVVDEAGTGIDFISEGNAYLNTPRTSWTLTPRTDFNVNFDVKQEHKICPVAGGGDPITYSEYYTTLYTDFAYTLPEDGSVKAYKVVHVNDTTGVAIRKEITGTIPAQTPVMLISKTEGNKTLTLSTQDGVAVTGNLLVGADELINEYEINSPTAEGILNMLKSLSESLYNDYEYLARKNSGTVNNKYFFGLTEEDAEKCVVNKDCVIRNLSTDDNEKTAFHESWEAKANKALLVSEKFNSILLSLVGDVNRDGTITIGDVTALVNIILGKAKYPDDKDKYDFEAADVNGDSVITIGDVTKLVNIILGKE